MLNNPNRVLSDEEYAQNIQNLIALAGKTLDKQPIAAANILDGIQVLIQLNATRFNAERLAAFQLAINELRREITAYAIPAPPASPENSEGDSGSDNEDNKKKPKKLNNNTNPKDEKSDDEESDNDSTTSTQFRFS